MVSELSTPALSCFNTLAQNGTSQGLKTPIIVKGNGSDLNNIKALRGRAKRKMITQAMVLSLIDVTENTGNDERKKGYWNTYYCQNKIYTANGRLFGKYCKNRFCTLCCSIRKAEIINKYLPVIQTWSDPYFLTLTIKARSLVNLNKFMKGVLKAFQLINSKYRKRNIRGKGIKLMGVKSLECNFNPVKRTYNPHLHLIVPNKEIGEILIVKWLKIWGPKFTPRAGQHSAPVKDREKALIEIIKYGSKIFTEPDVNKKSKSSGTAKIHVAALDNIFKAMKEIRIFERFGFNLPKDLDLYKTGASLVSDYDEWIFDPQKFDWLNLADEKCLSEYIPLLELKNLLENSIDKDIY